MLVLGIETATTVCGVALVEEGDLVGESRVVGANLHNERLHGMLRSLLGHCRVKPTDVDGVAVSVGPGSFTGLRIGVAAAKGLAFATGAKLVGVPTLEALAAHAPEGVETVWALVPAKAKLFYLGEFRRQGDGLQLQGGVQIIAADALPERVPAGALLIGPGCWQLGSETLRAVRTRAHVELSTRSLASAATVALIGQRRLAAGHADDVAALEPVYGLEFVAARPKRVIDSSPEGGTE